MLNVLPKGGHQLTWSQKKAGELQFSDRGTEPKKAILSSRRDSFVLGMGGTHEGKRVEPAKQP